MEGTPLSSSRVGTHEFEDGGYTIASKGDFSAPEPVEFSPDGFFPSSASSAGSASSGSSASSAAFGGGGMPTQITVGAFFAGDGVSGSALAAASDSAGAAPSPAASASKAASTACLNAPASEASSHTTGHSPLRINVFEWFAPG